MRPETSFFLLTLFSTVNAAVGPSLHSADREAQYTAEGREKVLPSAFKTYLNNVKHTSVELPAYSEERLPKVGISVSGGGYQGAWFSHPTECRRFFGAGVLNALDARNASSVEKGTGGLLQRRILVVTSLAQANFPTIQHLIFGDGRAEDYAGWLTDFNLFVASTDPAIQSVYAVEVLQELAVKAEHFPVSVGDVWGRTLARHFTNGMTLATFFANTSHGAGILFSDLIDLPTFVSHQQPLPILAADLDSKHITGTGRSSLDPSLSFPSIARFSNSIFKSFAGQVTSQSSLAFVVEMSCFDPVLGTTNNPVCVTGFDEAMFLSGASSNLWNEFNGTVGPRCFSSSSMILMPSLTPPAHRLDTCNFPNAFHGVVPETFADSGETILALCDGGEDGEVSPLQPMLVKDRKIDVIIEIDVNSDGVTGENYAGGSSLVATGERMKIFQSGLAAFPRVPSNASTFATEGLNTGPTFFGCRPSANETGPLLLSSAPLTNSSTGQMVYGEVELQGILQQTFVVATQEWGACLACAVDRARAREGARRSGVC
ncbi:lysophospholipase [Roridomyces roridus]|uniref:Lysophospholipase n=1 Tax=Roridomyces roridus TaxID=1738132 RepID=A0AAD7C1B7_9AGAR|nr:lysophospholipase [Roridomyces roridus]